MADGVVVVGAGPVGMTAALALARAGVDCTVLDAAPGLSGEGSKAICVQRDVLDILDRLGVGRAIAEEGVSWTLGRTYFRSRELFTTRLPRSSSMFPPFVNLPQSRTEELLADAVAAHPRIDLRWEHEVIGLSQDAAGVTLSLSTPLGAATLHAGWVVGCDGGRSRIRTMAGVGFPGHGHPDRFLIADIRADLPFPSERRFFFDPPFNPGRTVLIHPQPHHVWRIDWQVPAETDVQEERSTGRLDARIRAIVGDTPYQLVWLSSYRFSQRIAERFRVGRVLLAGDAAHLMSPFGARGMNSGMHDAENLAWKLGLVVRGSAPESLLDSYHDERHAAALENLRVTDATMRFMVPPTSARRVVRNTVLRSSAVPAMRRLVNSGRLAEPFDYQDSPVVELPPPDADIDPRAGQLAPDGPCEVPGEDHPRRLRELVGPEMVLFTLLDDQRDAARFLEDLRRRPPRVPLRIVLAAVPGRLGVLAPLARDDVMVVSCTGGVLERIYRTGFCYVIRPDGYLGAGPSRLRGSRIGRTIDRCAGYLTAAGRELQEERR